MGPCDCGSRGRKAVLEEVLRHQRLVPDECAVPPAFSVFMDSAVSFLHSLADEDRARDVAVLERLAVRRASLRPPVEAGPSHGSSLPPSPPPSPSAVSGANSSAARPGGHSFCGVVSCWVGWVRRRFLSAAEMAVGHSVVCDVAGDGARFAPAAPLTRARADAPPPPAHLGRVPIALPRPPSTRVSAGPLLLTIAAVDAATRRVPAVDDTPAADLPGRVGPPRITQPSVLNRVLLVC